MRRNILLACTLIGWLLLFAISAQGQETVRIGEYEFVPDQNMGKTRGGAALQLPESVGGQRNVLVQLEAIPSAKLRAQLAKKGVELQEYLGGKAYWALLSVEVNPYKQLRNMGIRSVMPIRREWKYSPFLLRGEIPSYARVGAQGVRAIVSFAANAEAAVVRSQLARIAGVQVENVSEVFRSARVVLPLSALEEVGALPYVLAVNPVSQPMELYNQTGGSLGHAPAVQLAPGLGGRGLLGEGVRIGVWDGNVSYHPDFGERLHTEEYNSAETTAHATHVVGSIIGAGMLDARARGVAPEAEVWAWNFGKTGGREPAEEMLATYRDKGISLSSNSYGLSIQCPAIKKYRYTPGDANLDRLALEVPTLTNVFAVGNEQIKCNPETREIWGVPGYGTVLRMAKNYIAVGAVKATGAMGDVSSWGPLPDGRLFPTVCAKGHDVYSTFPDWGYGEQSGSSMATPLTSGMLALVSQRYKQLHKGSDIPSVVLKAIAANTATDAGRKGPDFQYGFGIMNTEKAVEAVENKWYDTGKLSQGKKKEFTIEIPAGATALKVMLCWHDAVKVKQFAWDEKMLVNDLDLTVDGVKPLVLNPKKGHVEDLAVPGEDHINNIEQVVIENPTAGKHKIVVDGYELAGGEQEFAIAWYVEQPKLRILSPGNNVYAPGERFTVNMEGITGDSYSIDLSYDGGKSFMPMGGHKDFDPLVAWKSNPTLALPADSPMTANAILRVRCSVGSVAVSKPFAIAPRVEGLELEANTCAKTGKLTWKAAEGNFTHYAVLWGDTKTGEFAEIATVAKGTEEYTLKPEDMKPGVLTVAVKIADEAFGPRAKGVVVTAPQELTGDQPPPYVETFATWPASKYFSSTVAKNTEVSIKQSSNPSVPAGSNMLLLKVMKDASWGYDKGNIFAEKEENRAQKAMVSMCSYNLPAGKKIFFHLRGSMYSVADEPQVGVRLLVDGQVVLTTTGKEVESTLGADLNLYWPLAAGSHSLALEFAGASLKDILAIESLSIEEEPALEDYQIAIAKSPKAGANLGKGKFLLVLKSNCAKTPSQQVAVRLTVNGGREKIVMLPPLKPYETVKLPVELDLSTPEALGENMRVEVEADFGKGDGKPANNRAEVVVPNLGNIFPMPLPEMAEGIYGMQPKDPRIEREVKDNETIIFTDNGGVLGDHTTPDYSTTVRFFPENPSRVLQVRFKRFNMPERGAVLAVYRGDVPENLDMLQAGRPTAMFTGLVDEEYIITSNARSGGLTFHCEAYAPGEGWIAEITTVARENPLTLVGISAHLQGEKAEETVPVDVTVRNNWGKAVEGFSLILEVQDDKNAYILDPLTLAANEEKVFTFSTALKLKQMTTKGIRVTLVSDKDDDNSDNIRGYTAVYDRYCIPRSMNRKGYDGTELLTLGKSVRTLAGAETHIIYDSEPINWYREFADQSLTVKSRGQVPYKVFCWVDWDNDGTFADSEKMAQEGNAAGELNFKLVVPPTAKGGHKRMRLAWGKEEELAKICTGEHIAYGSVRDYVLNLIDNATTGDIAITKVETAPSGLNMSATAPVTVYLTNGDPTPFEGQVKARVTIDGGAPVEEIIDLAGNAIAPLNAEEKAVALTNTINLSAVGLHKVLATIEEQPAVVNAENNTAEVEVRNTVPAIDGNYFLSFNTLGEHKGKEKLTVEKTGFSAYTSKFSLSFWMKADGEQFGTLISCDDMIVASTYNMQFGIPDNALLLGCGSGSHHFTPANSLTPNQWHHIAIVCEGQMKYPKVIMKQLTVYIDGKKQDLTSRGEEFPTLLAFEVGTNFRGAVDNLRLWTNSLEESDVKEDMAKAEVNQGNCKLEFAFNEGVGNWATYSKGTSYMLKTYADSRIQEKGQLWKKHGQQLLADASFQGMVSKTSLGESRYEVLFLKGAPTTVIGFLKGVYPNTKMTYEGNAVTESTDFDFSKDVEIVLEATYFGKTYTQTVTFVRKEDASNACDLLLATLPKAGGANGNEGIAADVILSKPSMLAVFALAAAPVSPEAMHLKLEASASAEIKIAGETYQASKTYDLSKPLTVEVVAENGRDRKFYTLRLQVAQTLSWTLAKSDYTYGDAPVALEATATSGLPVTVVSDHGNVANVENGVLHIMHLGTANLVATQLGNDVYGEAEPVKYTVKVGKAKVTVTPAVANVEYPSAVSWRYAYETLVSEQDVYLLPDPKVEAGYTPVDEKGVAFAAEESLPKGIYTLKPTKAQYETPLYTVEAKAQEAVRVASERYVEVTFKATQNAAAYPNLRIACGDYAVVTDAHGLAKLPVLAYADYKYVAQAEGVVLSDVLEVKDKDFEITIEMPTETVTLRYTASAGGSIAGIAHQKIAKGTDAQEVVAVPAPGYEFIEWEDSKSKEAHRADRAVQNDLTANAVFAKLVYTMSYELSEGGAFADNTTAPKTFKRNKGESAEKVEVKAQEGYYFVRWSDGETKLTRTDICEGNLSVKALFAKIEPLPYMEDFNAEIPYSWLSIAQIPIKEAGFVHRSGSFKFTGYTLNVGAGIAFCDGDIGSNRFMKTTSTFTSPLLSIKGVQKNVVVTYDYIFSGMGMWGSTGEDILALQYRVDDDAWVTLTPKHNSTNGNLVNATAEIEFAKLENHETLQLRYSYSRGSGYYAGVDNVSIAELKDEEFTLTYAINPVGVAKTKVEGHEQNTQKVKYGRLPKEVTLEFDAEQWQFVKWSNGQTTTTLKPVLPIYASETITAEFTRAHNYRLRYTAMPAEGGSFTIDDAPGTEQRVLRGENAKPVEAKPAKGYAFAYWADNGSDNPRREDVNVQNPAEITAVFKPVTRKVSFVVTLNGKPLHKARVSVLNTANSDLTDDKGKVSFSLIPRATAYAYQVDHPDCQSQPETEFTLEEKDVEIPVEMKPKPLHKLCIIPPTVSLSVGEMKALALESFPKEAPASVVWKSDNPLIAKVDAEGNVEAIAPGTATITVTSTLYPSISATCKVTVTGVAEMYPISIESEGEGILEVLADGVILTNGQEVPRGVVLTIYATPAPRYILQSLTVNTLDIPSGQQLAVNQALRVKAVFKQNRFTLRYAATNGGRIKGTSFQEVALGGDGELVEAVPDKGYIFVTWCDGINTAKRQDRNVRADINVEARFRAEDTPTPVEEATIATAPRAYPNPAHEVVHFESPSRILRYEVLAVDGSVVQSASHAAATLSLDIADLPAGVYTLQVVDEHGAKQQVRFVKQ